MSKKDDKPPPPQHHTGSIVAEDDEFTLWLNRLWARNEPPSRIEVWQMFGKNKADRGEMVFHEDFPAGEKLDIEQANRLANEVMASVQNDCDAAERKSWYQLAVIDRNRKGGASPLVRRIGPLEPKRSYALSKKNDTIDEDDEDALNAMNLNLRMIKEGMDQSRWDKNRNDRVGGEMLILQDSIIRNQQMRIDSLCDRLFLAFDKQQEAQDRSAQREIMVEKEKFKLGLMKEGIRTARNILPGLFAKEETNGAALTTTTTTTTPTNGSTNGHAGPKDYGPSPERALVDNLLNDFEEAKIELPLFGNWEDVNGKWTQTSPGIFTPKQFAVLYGVREGRLPVTTLDNLMPMSGHEMSITQEQIEKASDAGVTEGMATALFELLGLRTKAKEAAQAAAGETDTETETE